MKRRLAQVSLFALAMGVAAASVEAKTLVFCSEGSPEGFNPQLFTSGTTFDASSRQIFNRLFQPNRGETAPQPKLAEPEVSSGSWVTSSFDLLHGTDIVESHDPSDSGLFDDFVLPDPPDPQRSGP